MAAVCLNQGLHHPHQPLRVCGGAVINAAFDAQWQWGGVLHPFQAFSHLLWTVHEAGAEPPLTGTAAGTSQVEVDAVQPMLLDEAGAAGQLLRVVSSQLRHQRSLRGVVGQQPRRVAGKQCMAGEHLGVEQAAAADESQQIALMPVRIAHHRRHLAGIADHTGHGCRLPARR